MYMYMYLLEMEGSSKQGRINNKACTCSTHSTLINMNNHMHRTPFSDIHVHVERKKEVAKSKERRKEIHNFMNYYKIFQPYQLRKKNFIIDIQ